MGKTAETAKGTWEVKRMEDTIKIELLTPLTGNFTSRELERQWEEGEYEYDVYEGLPLEGADIGHYRRTHRYR